MVQKHIHTYKQVRAGSNQFKCIHPECTHLNTKELIKGKIALCNGCTSEFILTAESLRRVYPKCSKCIKGLKDSILVNSENLRKTINETKEKIDDRAIESLVKEF